MIELLGHRARRALGIDRSPEMLRLARGKIEAAGLCDAEVRHGDMYALPPVAADTVVIHQVLHFADDPAAVIAEAAARLAPGGQLLIVDFAPHEREELRQRDAHVRLGFSDEQVLGWFAEADVAPARTETLEGGELTVKLWLGRRVAPAQTRVAA